MKLLFYVAGMLSFCAIAATVYAFFSAGEGFEDEEGFHPVAREGESTEAEADSESKLPPFLSAQ